MWEWILHILRLVLNTIYWGTYLYISILGNPRQMFTDSAFYSPKFHPSVAEQVEMAHRLSSSLYTDDNKMSKGQEMYLKRAKKSGKWVTTNQSCEGMC